MKEEKKWTKEEVANHIKLNDDGYGSMVVCAALYNKLYGTFPTIGLSGFQGNCAIHVLNKLPDTDALDLYAKHWEEATAKEIIRHINDTLACESSFAICEKQQLMKRLTEKYLPEEEDNLMADIPGQ